MKGPWRWWRRSWRCSDDVPRGSRARVARCFAQPAVSRDDSPVRGLDEHDEQGTGPNCPRDSLRSRGSVERDLEHSGGVDRATESANDLDLFHTDTALPHAPTCVNGERRGLRISRRVNTKLHGAPSLGGRHDTSRSASRRCDQGCFLLPRASRGTKTRCRKVTSLRAASCSSRSASQVGPSSGAGMVIGDDGLKTT